MRFLLFFSSLLLSHSLCPAQVTAEAPVSKTGGPDSQETEIADYVRFLESPDSDRLQTAVTRFEKNGTIVDLVAVVHLADAEYFENLNQLLSGYDLVLYEMVGGAYSPDSNASVPTAQNEMAGLRQLQTMAKSFLGLEFQLEGIDYSPDNFVHADVEWDGLDSLMTARNQNFSEIFSRAMALSQEDSIPGLPSSEAAMSSMLGSLLTAVTTGNSTELKRTIAPLLSEAEGFITKLEGDDGTVLVTERNKIVIERLRQEQAARGEGKYAIFYGAGHMPDLEDRLVALGYEKQDTAWADAWSLDHGPAEVSESPAVAPGDFLLNLLEENPEVMDALQKIGEMLEQVQTEGQ